MCGWRGQPYLVWCVGSPAAAPLMGAGSVSNEPRLGCSPLNCCTPAAGALAFALLQNGALRLSEGEGELRRGEMGPDAYVAPMHPWFRVHESSGQLVSYSR